MEIKCFSQRIARDVYPYVMNIIDNKLTIYTEQGEVVELPDFPKEVVVRFFSSIPEGLMVATDQGLFQITVFHDGNITTSRLFDKPVKEVYRIKGLSYIVTGDRELIRFHGNPPYISAVISNVKSTDFFNCEYINYTVGRKRGKLFYLTPEEIEETHEYKSQHKPIKQV